MNILDSGKESGQHVGRRVWSLLEMASLFVGRLNDTLLMVRLAQKTLKEKPDQFRMFKDRWIDALEKARWLSDTLELEGPGGHLEYVIGAFDDIPDEEMAHQLIEIERHLNNEAGLGNGLEQYEHYRGGVLRRDFLACQRFSRLSISDFRTFTTFAARSAKRS